MRTVTVTHEEKRRLWRWFSLLLFGPIIFSVCIVYTEWANRAGIWMLQSTPEGVIRSMFLRLYENTGGAAVAGILIVWILSPFTAASGYILMNKIVGYHIIWITPHRTATVIGRLIFSFLILFMVIFSVIILPGNDSIYCKGCEQHLLPLLLLNHAQMYALGAIVGYMACLFAILNIEERTK